MLRRSHVFKRLGWGPSQAAGRCRSSAIQCNQTGGCYLEGETREHHPTAGNRNGLDGRLTEKHESTNPPVHTEQESNSNEQAIHFPDTRTFNLCPLHPFGITNSKKSKRPKKKQI
uniref:Uncharacterized protein n=1 Tax=Anguilla anguilla TaxID=7936 RepID=A0A0E9XML0_ANGAN